ncbi:MAG: Stk1 family PASTA domain-containing Ser/Thr kinase [Actinobacteria bacterium]|nr:Stk1 family PASTA domain-containing Ser/Thr kinase [Actinomycetota bacterium]MDA3002615.1 Stk1 family PASTA domain-containing Ser/Thr kinase [Actinomycetota bacterium]
MNTNAPGPWTGRLLGGRYEVREVIGRGGMADVYLGVDARLGRQVALKILKSTLSSDPTFRNRFRLEAMSASKMSHPSIVRVFDAGDEDNGPAGETPPGSTTPYIVMEHVEGHLLSALMRQGKLEERHILKVADGVLTALEVSHRAGIVHRDIKPANIMISGDGTVKVMDFGIARAVSDATGNLEQTTSILGTALYISPEQAKGEEPDTRTDLYSLGVVMYELLAGAPPFTSESPVSIAYKHISEEPRPLREVNPAVSQDVALIVEAAMKKELQERFPTAQAFRAAIEDVAQGRPPKLPAPGARVRIEAAVTGSVPQATVEPEYRTHVEGFEIFESRGIKQQSVPTLAIGMGSVLAMLFVIGVVLWVFTLNPSTTATTAAPAVPALINQTEGVATQTISALGLTPDVEYEANAAVPEGIVIETFPEEGTRVAPGEPVRIVVSSGIARFNLPDVRNIDIADARVLLEERGLVVESIVDTYSPSLEEGLVMATTPQPDTPVRPGDAITITVSNGKVLIPNVVGLTVGEANPFLTGPSMQLSVRLEIATDCIGQTVRSQSLPPGEHPQRSEITLTYCGAVAPEDPAASG